MYCSENKEGIAFKYSLRFLRYINTTREKIEKDHIRYREDLKCINEILVSQYGLKIIRSYTDKNIDNCRYKLTIITYKLLFGAQSISGKDFNIYLRGLKLDVETFTAYFEENTNYIVIIVTKNDAIEDGYVETDFEIVSKWDNILIGLGAGNNDWLTTENEEDITR